MEYAKRCKYKKIVARFLSWSFSIGLAVLHQIGVLHWMEARTIINMREYIVDDLIKDPREATALKGQTELGNVDF